MCRAGKGIGLDPYRAETPRPCAKALAGSMVAGMGERRTGGAFLPRQMAVAAGLRGCGAAWATWASSRGANVGLTVLGIASGSGLCHCCEVAARGGKRRGKDATDNQSGHWTRNGREAQGGSERGDCAKRSARDVPASSEQSQRGPAKGSPCRGPDVVARGESGLGARPAALGESGRAKARPIPTAESIRPSLGPLGGLACGADGEA